MKVRVCERGMRGKITQTGLDFHLIPKVTKYPMVNQN